MHGTSGETSEGTAVRDGVAGGDDTAGSGVAAFVRRWAADATVDSNVDLYPQQVRDALTAHVAALADVLRTQDGPLDRVGRGVGTELVSTHFTGPSMLSVLVTELQTGLLRAVGLPDDAPRRERLARLCGAVTTGYVEAFRDQLLDEQESIKTAALTASRDAEELQRRSEARLAAVFDSTGIGIGIGDTEGKVVHVNPAMAAIFGRTADDMFGRRVLDMVHPADKERLTDFYTQMLRGEVRSFSEEFQVLHADGEPVWTHVTMSMMPREGTEAPQAIATVENVSDLQLLRGEFNRQNSHDWLTGLPNQTQLRRRIEDLTGLAKPGDKLALCFFDIDGFKVINDGLGHEIGDALLRNMGTVLRSVFDGKSSLVARVAGDGFAVLIDKPASTMEVTAKVDRAQDVLNEPIYIHKKDGVAVSTSVGIVVYEAADISPDELIRAAEITVHRAKAAGKAQWMLYEQEQDETDRRRFHLGAIMPGAIETGEFTPLFAPVRTLGDRTFTGYHVSLRWRHKDYGMLTEADFGALAVETGLAVGLDKWLIEQCCQCLGEWLPRYGDVVPSLAFNLSPRMARDQNLVKIVRDALTENNVPGEYLYVFFPAETLADPDGEARDSLETLARLGVVTLADGFGGGPSLLDIGSLPLAALRLLPEASVRSVDPAVAPGLGAFVTLSHDAGVMVSAADVDSEEQAQALAAIGVDAACGEVMGRELTADEVAATLG